MSKHPGPVIDHTSFGSITVDGEVYEYDIVITLQGQVKKRKKKLSKAIYGTSHTLSLQEIEHIYQEEAEGIVIGSGQYGVAKLSGEAASFLAEHGCRVFIQSTPEAIKKWNSLEGNTIGLFHITC
jgi:hypothetical protein